MESLIYLIPIALFLGLLGLAAFLWAMRSGQFDDLDGAAERILFDNEDEPKRDLWACDFPQVGDDDRPSGRAPLP
jgi:cbb3-type cytochrome oxidase maturation protein